MLLHVAWFHPLADKFVFSYFGNGFGPLALVYGDFLTNQFNGFSFIRFIGKEMAELKVVTRTFHPAAIVVIMRPSSQRSTGRKGRLIQTDPLPDLATGAVAGQLVL